MSKKLTVRVSRDFLGFTPEHKGTFGQEVIDDMTDNVAVFATPDVPLGDLQTLNETLVEKIGDAAGGDHDAVLERDAAEQAWDEAMKKEALYVEHIAKGDLVIIGKSGLHATRSETQAAVRPGKAILDAFGTRTHGTVHAEIKKLEGSLGSLFIGVGGGLQLQNPTVVGNQISFSINGNPFVVVLSTKRAVDFQGLQTGTNLGIAGVAFNAAGLGDPSEPQFVVVP